MANLQIIRHTFCIFKLVQQFPEGEQKHARPLETQVLNTGNILSTIFYWVMQVTSLPLLHEAEKQSLTLDGISLIEFERIMAVFEICYITLSFYRDVVVFLHRNIFIKYGRISKQMDSWCISFVYRFFSFFSLQENLDFIPKRY